MLAFPKCTLSQTWHISFKVPEPPRKPVPEEVPVPIPKKVEPPAAKGRIIFFERVIFTFDLVSFVSEACVLTK
jgi:hypothetical protein